MSDQIPEQQTFNVSFPSGDDLFSQVSWRKNFIGLYEGDHLPFRPLAHASGDMSIMVLGTDQANYFNNVYYGNNNQRIPLSSGDSPAMVAPVTNSRIDLIYADPSGDVAVQSGTEAASPAIPNAPSGDCFPICAIYHKTTTTAIRNYEDRDTYTGDSYIQKDLRPLYDIPRESEASDVAALDDKIDENTVNLAKTNFKVMAYHTASRYELKDMFIDTYSDALGIDAGRSSGYTWRDTPNYDITTTTGDVPATVITIEATGDSAPTEGMIIADVTIPSSGDIDYYLSRDSGTTWTVVSSLNTMTDLTAQPSGTQVRAKVIMSGGAEINSMAFAF